MAAYHDGPALRTIPLPDTKIYGPYRDSIPALLYWNLVRDTQISLWLDWTSLKTSLADFTTSTRMQQKYRMRYLIS